MGSADQVDDGEDTYDIHPRSPRWTHIALQVEDIEATIEWYTTHTPLEVVSRREDDLGYGAWLGHTDTPDHPFLLVVSQFFPETNPFGDQPRTVLGPFAHIGIELTSRAEVDVAAARADASGSLQRAPEQMPPPIGYICMVADPDGNTVEFSYDQGVYAVARDRMA